MTLQLPPTRPLPDASRMLDRILQESPAAPRRIRPFVIGGLIAAATAATVAAWIALQPAPGDQIADPPATSAPPTTVPATPVPSVRAGTSTTTRYLTVTMGDPVSVDQLYAISVQTCVRAVPAGAPSGLRLARDQWSLQTSKGLVTTSDPLTTVVPLPTTYPQEGRYPVGRCVAGYIPFGLAKGATVDSVVLDTGDNQVVWYPR